MTTKYYTREDLTESPAPEHLDSWGLARELGTDSYTLSRMGADRGRSEDQD